MGLKLRAVPVTEENFRPFGQLLGKIGDGCEYGSGEAQLNLANGIPRLYLMELKKTGLRFKRITHHARVTQCLGSVGAHPWYMAVSPPSIVDPSSQHEGAVRSNAGGHYYLPPSHASVQVFKIDGPRFIKLNEGTWHAGPLFGDRDSMVFYNLELSDTNVVDHTTHVFQDDVLIED
ncbi:hypothetical protein SELMODRAFT_413209 [Selaginella moellendorffii]|uniref:Ureidoglycolate hydrolase n=1 Tax=Selaginella moellendorffii TaxID=88036 RepID=D8RNP7_SELML|nr:uncharacterized protein LOC9651763 isoform X2 [Selaginella moellendorffii]EFJ26116.1 hypothetical protein SELMODRAFT_413209 [Selaginella moellendorffii]|eukprot:XP_002972895.1 uncharacterized protein LOC9651763 isoform X2 [Selaginella moellendorffii]